MKDRVVNREGPWEALRRPPRLRPGDAVGIVAPASPLKRGQRALVELSLAVLEGWGLRPRLAPGLWGRKGYLAGTDQGRASQLSWAFRDDEVRGVFCLRGGYGSMRILSLLERDLLLAHPKVFVGFSDATAILVYLLQAGQMVTFHGPTLSHPDLAGGPETSTARSLFRAVMETSPPETITGEAWAGGVTEGVLIGGCLSILAGIIGTPFAPRLRGAILFLEDVNEPLYRIDRMLTQLRLAGELEGVRGLVLGEGLGAHRSASRGRLRDLVLREFGTALPIVSGVSSGHSVVNLTLPLGIPVRLDGQRGVLQFLSGGVEG